MEFTLNGRRHRLARGDVESRLDAVPSEGVQQHGVRVNGVEYPVKQAFDVATGIPRTEFTSHTARRHLEALGFELVGEIDHRASGSSGPGVGQPSVPPFTTPLAPTDAAPRTVNEAWHTEARVQAAVVSHLVAAGWRILSVADTATRQHGIDIVASGPDGVGVGIEVKGYPSRHYADPRRAGEVKRTQPSTQAGHWYAQAVLAAMRLRTKRPELRSVIALPEFSRFRDLFAETQQSLDAAKIEIWWINESGNVTPS